jgi:hypothetical protein
MEHEHNHENEAPPYAMLALLEHGFGVGLDEKQIELLAFAVVETGKASWEASLKDPNDLEAKVISEEFSELLKLFMPISSNLQRIQEDFLNLPEEEMERLRQKSEADKSDLEKSLEQVLAEFED